jgi:transcription elongation GreA/GreB family factor
MNTSEIESILNANPDLRDQQSREKLEAMQDGAYCQHQTWGFGQIQSYDAANDRLIIDFTEQGKEKSGHRMAPKFCVKNLEILRADHILVRQKTEPKVIEELVKKDPAGLVKQILHTDEKQSMSIIELEGLLSRLLGPTKFKKWWASTKKILSQDPDVAVPAKKDGQYRLREDPVNPERELLDEYYLNKNPLRKILLAEELFETFLSGPAKTSNDGEKDDSSARVAKLIEDDLQRIFDELTSAIKSAKRIARPDPNDDEFTKVAKERAARLHGIWVRNDLCRHLQADVDSLEPTSASILLECDDGDLSRLAAEIPQTPAYLKRLLDLLTRVHPDPEVWKPIIISLLKNSTGKFTAECVNFLIDRECTDLVAEKLLEWLNGQELKSPVLLWIIKNRASKKYAEIVTPLASHLLLAAILYAIDSEALQSSSTRRIPLAEELSDDADLISDLLTENGKKVGTEIATDLAQSLLLNQGFDPLTKKSLLARFIKLHKSIESLVAGSGTEQSGELVVSQWSLDARRAELKEIIENKIPENKKAIAAAKEHGDLKENSEYKMARQDQDTLLARKASLERDLTLGRLTDFSEASTETVGIGSIVELAPENGPPVRYTILGAWDSDPDKNILSYKTPLAQKLLGAKPGTIVETEISGKTERWTVHSITRWVDVQK